jgi:hypothetical protein
VSKEPGGEYDEKLQIYAAMGVLYCTIYKPKHAERDGHEVFETYKLVQGNYVRQSGNPVWMPEIGLGIGHEVRKQEEATRDWLYWYDAAGQRYETPEDTLAQERVLREREQLMRRELEEQLVQEAQARLQSQQELEQEIRSYRSLLLRQLTRKVGAIDDPYLAQIDQLSTQQTAALGEDLLDFRAIDDLTSWLKNHG